jgi:hypothetical protein
MTLVIFYQPVQQYGQTNNNYEVTKNATNAHETNYGNSSANNNED